MRGRRADIIALDEAAVVFVEVNARTGAEAGFPAEAGTEAKRAKFECTAIAYMAGYEETDVSVRFDIISMVVIGESRAMLRHHINVLSAESESESTLIPLTAFTPPSSGCFPWANWPLRTRRG